MDILAWMKAYTTLVKQKIAGIDLTGYAKKTDIPAQVDTSGFATKTDLQAVKDSIPADVDLSAYAKKTDVPSVDGFLPRTDFDSFRNGRLITVSSCNHTDVISGSGVVHYIVFSNGLKIYWGTTALDDDGDGNVSAVAYNFPVKFVSTPSLVYGRGDITTTYYYPSRGRSSYSNFMVIGF